MIAFEERAAITRRVMIKGAGDASRQASSKSEHRGLADRFSGWWSNDALLAT